MDKQFSFNTIGDVAAWLSRIPRFQDVGASAANMDLGQITDLLNRLDNPQNKYPGIHVAGTNGKGTVCHMLARVYRDRGLRVGLYTSPHLIRLNERIRINGIEIPDEDILSFFQQNEEILSRQPCTYFELLTALAFWYFAEQKIDLAILETGLGGRLDATNVVNPLVSVITSIGMDHKEILGDTIEKIAAEKAGIIKQDKPVVVGAIPDEALRVIRSIADQKNAQVVASSLLEPRRSDGKYYINDNNKERYLESDYIQAAGDINFAIGWSVVKQLFTIYPVTWNEYAASLHHFPQNAELFGRFEPLIKGREWYFDAAHNPEAWKIQKQTLKECFKGQKPVLICSLMNDKLTDNVGEWFSDFKKILYYNLKTPRAACYVDVASIFGKVERLPDKEDEVILILNQLKDDFVIFGGSFYLYSTVKSWIHSLNPI
ncbi:MAG TPA: folylpolyglutamate synthase/dihydrofolate synthase family protein [Balneolales bacterium]|nr:folylpolyglutamate synthase/dihydrofolate synthase family protein [Balneolales bacterium]